LVGVRKAEFINDRGGKTIQRILFVSLVISQGILIKNKMCYT